MRRLPRRLLAAALAAALSVSLAPLAAAAKTVETAPPTRRTLAADYAPLDVYELFGGDDTMATARDITSHIPRRDADTPGWGMEAYCETHTIDTATMTDWDEDWYKFTVSADDYVSWTQLSYRIDAYTTDSDVEVVVDVFGPGHMVPTAADMLSFPQLDPGAIESNDDCLWTAQDYTVGSWSSVSLVPRVDPSSSGTFYIRVRPYHSNTVGFTGEAGTYQLRIKFGQVERLAGADRMRTALRISQEGWPTRPAQSRDTSVVLAYGWGYADALAASSLAGACGMPVLLTRADHLPAEVKAEILRLGVKGVYIVGGPPTISNAVIEDLQVFLPPSRIKRVAGDDRVKTSVAVLHETKAVGAMRGLPQPDAAILVHGYNFPDALAVSPFAYADRIPVILTHKDYLDPAAAVAIDEHASDVVVAGDTNAVSAAAVGTLNEIVPSTHVLRIGGRDRYETAKEFAAWSSDLKGPGTAGDGRVGTPGDPTAWTALTSPYFNAYASGANFPDALAGGAFAGRAHAPLLLTHPLYAPVYLFGADGEMPTGATSWFSDLAHASMLPITTSYLFGGDSAVSEGAFLEIDNNTGEPGL